MKEFTLIFKDGLAAGLRASAKNPRNVQALVECIGAVPENGIIHALEDIRSFYIDTSGLDVTFPFPQIFVLSKTTLVCTQTNIYELVLDVLNPVFLGAPAGSTWTVADYGRFIVMTNGACMLVRSATTNTFELYDSCDIPPCQCVCDVNGQMFVGAPGVVYE